MSKTNKKDTIVQSNDLIEAYYDADLTVNEHKIIRYVASKIQKDDKQFPDYSFEVKEFAKAAGVKGNAYHKKIEKIADEITKKRIKIKSAEKIGWFPWFSGIVYEKGVVYLSFNTKLKDLLINLNLENGYTKYPFDVIAPLKSSYSIRLYELLAQYKKIGQRTIELQELRKMLGLTDDKYPEYANFKQMVLKRAKKELDDKTKLSFEFEEIRKSRKVVAIKFIITSEYDEKNELVVVPQLENKEGSQKDEEQPQENAQVMKIRAAFARYSESIKNDDIVSWLEEFGEAKVLYAAGEIRKRKSIKHPLNYIKSILDAEETKIGTTKNPAVDIEKDQVQNVVEKIIVRFSDSREALPDWFLESKSLEMFKEELNLGAAEAKELWEKHQKFIIDSIKDINLYTK